MPEFRWRPPALISILDDQTVLGQPLLLTSVSCLAPNAQRLRAMLSRRTAEALRQIPAGQRYRFLLSDLPDIREITVEVPPLPADALRRQPVNLPLQYVVWPHGGDAVIAYVPALGIEVLAEDERQLAELLQPQVKLALTRMRAAYSLRDLTALARYRALQVRRLPLKLKLPTLKEAALKQANEAEQQKSVLKEVGSNLAIQPSQPVYEREAEVQRLAELLTRRSPSSVLLVGRSGVGKTAIVQQLARRSKELGLGPTPLWSTSGSRIVAGMTGFGMWQERCEQLVREASKAKAVLHLGNLVELIEVGKGGGNLQGVAALLRPHLDRGALLAIAECTPEQLAVIEREEPQLLETFTQLEVAASSAQQTRDILRAVTLEQSRGPRLPLESLLVLDRLHRRWATYSASPGRQLRFLRNLLSDFRGRANGASWPAESAPAEITPAEVTAAFSRETGLPLFMLDDALPLDLDDTRAWFEQRVIGQSEAVQQVVHLLATVKTGLVRAGKPIASLLFIGPTGVGKTEMAKSLAEFLYQDRGRMIRFDMSEYSHPLAVERLIGGAYSAQGLLTQKVRDQPFTVVLLDEFEKAHPQFFDVLLQVLGEGRLTDGAGRVTDFSNSVVIMTSNLGAESYRRGSVGFAGETAAPEFAERHFEREVKQFLRPEMFNRLDRIVPFAPLDRATIAAIARREVSQVLARDGLRFRGAELNVDDAVVERLAEGGFDPRYGARPLKRAVERQLVAPLAAGLNRYAGEVRLSCCADLDDDRVRVAVDARPAGALGELSASLVDALQLVIGLRRHVQALQQSGVLTRLSNEIERIRQMQRSDDRRRKQRGLATRYAFTPAQARLLGHEELLERVAALSRDVTAVEDDSLLRFYANQPLRAAEIEARWAELDGRFRQLLFELPRVEGGSEKWLTLAAFGEKMTTIVELLAMYREICQGCGDKVQWFWLKMYRPEHDESLIAANRPVQPPPGPPSVFRLLSRKEQETDERRKVIDVFHAAEDPLAEIPADCIGIAMQITGERSVALLQTESGRHEFLRVGGGRDSCQVETVMNRLLHYDPPRDIGRRGSLSDLHLRRTYDLPEEEVRDELLKRTLAIRARRTDEALRKAVEEYLTVRLWELVEAWS